MKTQEAPGSGRASAATVGSCVLGAGGGLLSTTVHCPLLIVHTCCSPSDGTCQKLRLPLQSRGLWQPRAARVPSPGPTKRSAFVFVSPSYGSLIHRRSWMCLSPELRVPLLPWGEEALLGSWGLRETCVSVNSFSQFWGLRGKTSNSEQVCLQTRCQAPTPSRGGRRDRGQREARARACSGGPVRWRGADARAGPDPWLPGVGCVAFRCAHGLRARSPWEVGLPLGTGPWRWPSCRSWGRNPSAHC